VREDPGSAAHLDRLAGGPGAAPAALENVRGHRLPMRELGAPAASGRVLLVGDAAGLVDPLSGDGVYEAFVSAKLAAAAILERRVDDYEAALSGALDHHASASWKAKRVPARYPGAGLCATQALGGVV